MIGRYTLSVTSVTFVNSLHITCSGAQIGCRPVECQDYLGSSETQSGAREGLREISPRGTPTHVPLCTSSSARDAPAHRLHPTPHPTSHTHTSAPPYLSCPPIFTRPSPYEQMPTTRDMLGPETRAALSHHVWVRHPGLGPGSLQFGHMASPWAATATVPGFLGAAQNPGKQKPGDKSEGNMRSYTFISRVTSEPLLPGKE